MVYRRRGGARPAAPQRRALGPRVQMPAGAQLQAPNSINLYGHICLPLNILKQQIIYISQEFPQKSNVELNHHTLIQTYHIYLSVYLPLSLLSL